MTLNESLILARIALYLNCGVDLRIARTMAEYEIGAALGIDPISQSEYQSDWKNEQEGTVR